MKCYRCGAEIHGDVKFCSRCGSPQGFTQELITAAAQGDQDAIAELYNRTYNNVYQSVRMLVKDEDMALDIVQDTYIRGFRYLGQLEDPNSFRAWIKRIGINTAKNYLKKKQPMLFSEMEGTEEDDGPELQFVDERQENLPEVAMDRQETARLIQEILDELSEEQRLVITMYYYEEMNAREIAEELGVSENTVRSRLNYGKKKIEAKVLELEKRDGIRLHSLAPVPFLLLLFRTQKVSAAVQPDGGILQGVQRMVGNSMSYGKPAGSYGTGASSGGRSAAAGGAKAAAAKGISTKVIAGVAAAAVTAAAGGAGVVYAVYSYHASKTENAAQIESSPDETLEKERLTEEALSEKAKNVLSAEEGLEAFGAGKATVAGKEYTGYFVSVEGVSPYDGHTYYSQGTDTDIPLGWLNYQIADLDSDGIPELVAVTACDTPVETSQESVSTIGVEVYEWDEGEQKARLASAMQTSDIYEESFDNILGMMVGSYFGSTSCFIFGEDVKYIGLATGDVAKYFADGVSFELVVLEYKGEELGTAAQPFWEMGSSFIPEEEEKYLQEMQELGISIHAEHIPRAVDTAAKMDQLVQNYQQIIKIQTEDITGGYENVDSWIQKAYSGEGPDPIPVTKIYCEGNHPASGQETDQGTAEHEAARNGAEDERNITAAQAYKKVLIETEKRYISYSFIDLDNDLQMELVATGDTATGADIYYMAGDNTVKSINMQCGQFCYVEGSGYLDNHWTRQETVGHAIYRLENGEMKALGGGTAHCPQYPGTDYSAEDFKANAQYSWEDQKVDRKTFEKNMESIFPYAEEECTRYGLAAAYTSLEEACREQLGITLEE